MMLCQWRDIQRIVLQEEHLAQRRDTPVEHAIFELIDKTATSKLGVHFITMGTHFSGQTFLVGETIYVNTCKLGNGIEETPLWPGRCQVDFSPLIGYTWGTLDL